MGGGVYHLSFVSLVLDLGDGLGDWDVLGLFFVGDLRDVFGLVLDWVVVGHVLLFGDLDLVGLGFVLDDGLLVLDVLDSGFALDGLRGRLSLDGLGLHVLHLGRNGHSGLDDWLRVGGLDVGGLVCGSDQGSGHGLGERRLLGAYPGGSAYRVEASCVGIGRRVSCSGENHGGNIFFYLTKIVFCII